MKNNKSGFTLVEIIVVITIIAIVAAFSIPTVLSYVEDARQAQYFAQVRSVFLTTQLEEAQVTWQTNEDAQQLYASDENFTAQMIEKVNERLETSEIQVTALSYYQQATTIAQLDVPADSYIFEYNYQDTPAPKAMVVANKQVVLLEQ